MKNVKQIRENYDLITEKEEAESRKLSTLVRAGLYDAKKLPALKKALEKTPDKMTGQEKRMLINLLDSLINQVVSNDQVFRKVKQNVQHMNEANDYYSKLDPRAKQGFPSDKDIPTVLILKRKAIRVYPDNQKVALYYSQALDKYVTIPFSDIQTGINEEVKKKEEKKKRGVGSLPVDTSSSFGTEGKKQKEKAAKEKQREKEKYSARNLLSRGHNVGGVIGIKAGMAAGNIARSLFAKRKAEKQAQSAPDDTSPAPASKPAATKAKPKSAPKEKPVKKTTSKPVLRKRSPAATRKIIQKNPNIQRSAAAMSHAGLEESFKSRLEMLREQAVPKEAPVNTFRKDMPKSPNSAQRYIRKPQLDKPANTGTKPSALDTVKRYMNKYAPNVAKNIVRGGKALSPLGAFATGLGTKEANPDESPNIIPTDQDKKNLGKVATAKELSDRVKSKQAAPSFEKTGRGTAPAVQTKPAPSPALKTGPSFEKTGRGTAPAKPAEAPKQPGKTVDVPGSAPQTSPAAPAPQRSTVPATSPDKAPSQAPTTAPRDKAEPYKSNAEKAAERVAQVQKVKNDKLSRSSGPKTRRQTRVKRRSNLELALAAGAAAATSAAANYDYKLKADVKNAWDLQQRDLPASMRQRQRQANLRALQQTNESVLSTLQNMIVSNITEQTLTINEQEININSTAAKKILYVYESINSTNKKKMEKMLNESADSFNKVLTFAIRQ